LKIKIASEIDLKLQTRIIYFGHQFWSHGRSEISPLLFLTCTCVSVTSVLLSLKEFF